MKTLGLEKKLNLIISKIGKLSAFIWGGKNPSRSLRLNNTSKENRKL